jgi:hypothetical protein
MAPAFLATAQSQRSRRLVKSFKAQDNTSIQVVNKYGNVHLVPWDKDSVRFDVQLNITGSKDTRVDRIFNDIDFEFTGTRYYVIARTVFRNSMNNVWTGINDATSSLFSGGNRAMVNYTIYFPAQAPVRVENKFGNIYTTDHLGKVEFILSNGDLKANALRGETILNLSFSNASIRSVERGRLEMGYGEFDFIEVGDAEIIGKSARIKIERAGRLRLDSRRDKLRIGRVGGLSGYSSFSFINVDHLTDEASIDTKYGELSVANLGAAVRSIEIDAEYTDLSIQGNQAMDIDLVYDDKTVQLFSDGVKMLKQEAWGEDKKQLRRSGPTDTGAGRYTRVRVRISGGRLTI